MVEVDNGGSVLTMRGVKKSFGSVPNVVDAVADVTFSVGPLETVAIVGPSGSGKSALLHIGAGLDTADVGTVELCGVALSGLSRDDRAAVRAGSVGVVFQDGRLISGLDASRNVALPLLLGGMDLDAAQDCAVEMLRRVGVGDRAGFRPAELSGGQLQRVAVARALVGSPKFVLADEPTGNLDAKNGQIVSDLLFGLANEIGCALLVATHDVTLASRANRVLSMEDGRLGS